MPLSGCAPIKVANKEQDTRARRRVLLAEDDAEFRALLVRYLESQGYAVDVVCDGAELLRALSDLLLDGISDFDAIVSDICMPVWTGVEVLNGLRCAGCNVPVVLVTACPSEQVSYLARELSAKLLIKPFDLDELADALACQTASDSGSIGPCADSGR
jgi:two-component system, response regulator, stage 0 sporulation protein F